MKKLKNLVVLSIAVLITLGLAGFTANSYAIPEYDDETGGGHVGIEPLDISTTSLFLSINNMADSGIGNWVGPTLDPPLPSGVMQGLNPRPNINTIPTFQIEGFTAPEGWYIYRWNITFSILSFMSGEFITSDNLGYNYGTEKIAFTSCFMV